MNRDILCKPFPSELIRQRPGRDGKTLSYVETHAVIARLNEGCDQWSFEVDEHSVHDDEVVVLGKLTADGVTKMAFGGSIITVDKQGRVVSLADDLKSASSDSLKKCATLLGVGLGLYGGAKPHAGNGRGRNGGRARNDAGNGGNGGNGEDPSNRITSRQLAAIHGSCRRLGVGPDALAGIVNERFGKDQIELLNKREASSLIDHFNSVVPAQY